jgi:hypothetical protein
MAQKAGSPALEAASEVRHKNLEKSETVSPAKPATGR